MFHKRFLLLIWVAFSLPQLLLAQGGEAIFDGSAARLTEDCLPYNGLNALPDGTVIQIRWDQNANGPDTSDQQVTVGSGLGQWNYNQFVLNGAAALGRPGAFFPAQALMSVGTLTQNRLFLAVMQPNNVDFRWRSQVFILSPGFNYFHADSSSGGWLCQALSCAPDYTLNAPGTYSSTTCGAGDDCNLRAGTDRIVEVNIPTTGSYTFSLCGSTVNWDSYMYVTTGCCSGTILAVNDDACGASATHPVINCLLLDAGTYYVDIEAWGAPNCNSFTLSVTSCGIPGDDCASAIEIDSLPYFTTGTTVGASDDFHALGNTSPDVIYTLVAPGSGMYLFSLCGSDFNTVLEVRTGGACPGTTQVAVNDDGCAANASNTLLPQSELLVRLHAGTTYFVIVDGSGSGSSGSIAFTVGLPDIPIEPFPQVLCCTPVDLVLVIDTTGSMSFGTFDSTGVAQIQAAAVALAGGSCGGPVDLRVGLVRFGDGSRTVYNLQTNYAQVFSALYAPPLGTGNGNNYPEGSDEALRDVLFGNSACAIGAHFNSGLFNEPCRLKIIMLLTDAPPAQCVDTYTPFGPAETNAANMANAAAARGIRICAVYRDVCRGTSLPFTCDNNVDRVMANYAATTGGRYADVAPNNVQTSMQDMIRHRGQGGLAICAVTDELYCDPINGVQPSPTHINVCVENFSTPPTNCSGNLSLVLLGGTGGTGVSITPSSVPLGTLAPNAQLCDLFTVNFTPNPLGGELNFGTVVTGSACVARDFSNICLTVPPCSTECSACPPGQSIFDSSAIGTDWNCYLSTWSSNPAYPIVFGAPVPPTATFHDVVSCPGNDPRLAASGVTLPRTHEGTYAIKLGSDITGGRAQRISRTFAVTPSNYLLSFAFAVVMRPINHPRENYFAYQISSSGVCGTIVNVFEPATTGNTFYQLTSDGNTLYHPWECVVIDLSSCMGQFVTLEFTTSNCADLGFGHTGYAYIDGDCLCGGPAQCCYCDSLGNTSCAMTTQAGCQALGGIWSAGLTCADPCPMIPGIDIDLPFVDAVTCSSGAIVPNPCVVGANIYNHQMSTCNDVSVSLTVSGSIGVTGTVLNSPIVLGNMSGKIGTNVAFNVQLNNINPGGAIICYNMVTHALGCCTDSVFICDTIPPCPCPYTDHDYEYPEPGVPITMDNDSCNTFSLDCGVCGCGEISSAGDVDWYPILNFGAPCNRLILNVYGNDTPLQFPFGKGLNPKIQLFHDDCVSQIAWDDDAGVGNDSYLSACLPTGNYRIKITGVGNSTGPYILCTSCEPCTCSAPCDEACDHQLTSLQNWWQLDELTGNTANEGVNQRDGSWINSPIPAPGKVGPSLRFNGTNYVRVPSHPQVETGSNSFSLDAWIYIENHPAPAAPMPIAGKTDASGKGFLLYIDILGYLAGWVKDGNSSHDLIAIDPVVVPAGWHLVTMTYTKHDGSNPNDVLTLYRCGNVVAQTTALTNLGPFTNSAPFEIANTQFPFFAKFMGRIDEVELWRRALRQDEVQQLCNADSLGKCKEFCHIPWDRYLCTLSNTATVGITLCNFTAFAQSYNWTVSGVTPYTWQCPFVPPVAYSWNPIWGPPTPLVAPGTCVTIPLTITAPPGLGFNDVSCYQVNFTSSSGETFCCKGSIWGRRRWCFGLNEYEISPLSVTVGRDTTFTFDVTNDAESSGLLPYTLEVMSPDPLLLGCRINGLPPGENYEGTLEVPMGQTGQLSVTLQMTEEQPLMMYDLMIGWDESGDNVPEFPLSIALRSLKESLAPQSPIITAIRSNGPGEIRLDWDMDPFASSYNVYKSDTSPDGPWTLLGATSLNFYVDSGAIATQFKRFYQVTAVDTPGDSLRVPQGGTQQK